MEAQPLDDETTLAAVSVFGARMRGEHTDADTPALAQELERRWVAEGHGTPSRLRRLGGRVKRSVGRWLRGTRP